MLPGAFSVRPVRRGNSRRARPLCRHFAPADSAGGQGDALLGAFPAIESFPRERYNISRRFLGGLSMKLKIGICDDREEELEQIRDLLQRAVGDSACEAELYCFRRSREIIEKIESDPFFFDMLRAAAGKSAAALFAGRMLIRRSAPAEGPSFSFSSRRGTTKSARSSRRRRRPGRNRFRFCPLPTPAESKPEDRQSPAARC